MRVLVKFYLHLNTQMSIFAFVNIHKAIKI